MIRTKHLLMLFVLLSIVLLVLVLFLLVRAGEQDKRGVIQNEVTSPSTTNSSVFGVAVDGVRKDPRVRESLLAKLGDRSGEADTEPEEEAVAPVEEPEPIESVPPDGGVLLGDRNISITPQVGYIYSCQQNFNGDTSRFGGPWVREHFWFPEEKIAVSGTVPWANRVSISTIEGARVITSNGFPNHTTGIYPIATNDAAYQYDRNPNRITAQDIVLQLPYIPTVASAPSCLPLGMIGVGLNGVALYNGLDAQGYDAAAHEIQDNCGGHPGRSGEYHYHNESECLLSSLYEGALSTLVGYALDGYGIFSSVENSVELRNEDLDICHGHTHGIPWNGSVSDLYHYHMTAEYPFSLGCFMGEPVEVMADTPLPSLPLGSGELPPFPPPQ